MPHQESNDAVDAFFLKRCCFIFIAFKFLIVDRKIANKLNNIGNSFKKNSPLQNRMYL